MIDLDLNRFAEGALKEKIEGAYEEVFKNIADKNTPSTAKRKIVAQLVFSPNEERGDVGCEIKVDPKLAPNSPIKTHIATGVDLDTGEIYAEEYGSGHIRGQISMDETKEDNIVDFRKQEVK